MTLLAVYGMPQAKPFEFAQLIRDHQGHIAVGFAAGAQHHGNILGVFGPGLHIDTMEQVYAKVRALTARQLTEVAEEVFSDMSRLIYK